MYFTETWLSGCILDTGISAHLIGPRTINKGWSADITVLTSPAVCFHSLQWLLYMQGVLNSFWSVFTSHTEALGELSGLINKTETHRRLAYCFSGS